MKKKQSCSNLTEIARKLAENYFQNFLTPLPDKKFNKNKEKKLVQLKKLLKQLNQVIQYSSKILKHLN